jgi:hypothetical protein
LAWGFGDGCDTTQHMFGKYPHISLYILIYPHISCCCQPFRGTNQS